MTLQHALGYVDEDSEYHVSLADRIRDLAPDQELGSDMTLVYSWSGGYESLEVKYAKGGSSDYRGSYHPNVVCEGGGICTYCGRTLFP